MNFKMPIHIIFALFFSYGAFNVNAQAVDGINCDIISPGSLSKFLWKKVSRDLSRAEIIFPTREVLNSIKSTADEDKLLRELWIDFINWSSIELTEGPVKTKYLGAESCVLSFNIVLDLNHGGFKERINVSNLVLQSTSNNIFHKDDFPFAVPNRNWQYLMISDDKMLLSKILDSFKRSLLMIGKWGNGGSFSSDYRKNLIGILNLYPQETNALPDLRTERYGSVFRYFSKEYPSDGGIYILNKNGELKISISRVDSDTFRVSSSLCNSTSVLIKSGLGSFYELNEDISKFELQFNHISVIVHGSKNRCFPSGKYFISPY